MTSPTLSSSMASLMAAAAASRSNNNNSNSNTETYRPKVLVLCFDGTTNAFDDSNTNVAKFFQLLDKSEPSKQLCYYQPGVGTYTLPSVVTPITSYLTKLVDMGVAWFFATHVTGGYRFIADNYLPGDKICLFGFSRGAYTARALAGMIEKVGLIPANNHEQLQFAWQMYKGKDKESFRLAKSFKETFSRDVDVDFVGVWDTVSSVGGIIEHHYPYTAKNKSIKIFRHALSLDERRVKFAQNRYHANTTNLADAKNDPERASAPCVVTGSDGKPCYQHDTWRADVREVYFAGDHTDVGGGSVKDSEPRQLSNISLMWMVSQVVRSDVGIKFMEPAFTDFVVEYDQAFSPTLLTTDLGALGDPNQRGADLGIPPHKANIGGAPYYANANIVPEVNDSLAIKKLGGFFSVPLWWILECFPFKRKYQDLNDPKKKWRVSFWPHFGKARTVAPGSLIHETVRDKMLMTTGKPYKPKPILPRDIEFVGND